MKPTITYRPADNAAYIRLSGARVLESAEISPHVFFDYDDKGRIVGIERSTRNRSCQRTPGRSGVTSDVSRKLLDK